MTLKYGQGHWEWYEQVKPDEWYHNAKFDIYHIYVAWTNPNVKSFWQAQTLDRRKTCQSPAVITHLSHTNHIVNTLFNVFSNHTMFKLQRTRIKTRNLLFIFLTHLWPWNWVKVIKLRWQCRPKARLKSYKILKILFSWCPRRSQR